VLPVKIIGDNWAVTMRQTDLGANAINMSDQKIKNLVY
jgi:hypothetical protein